MVKNKLNRHEDSHLNQVKCTFDNCEFVTKYKDNLKRDLKRKQRKTERFNDEDTLTN